MVNKLTLVLLSFISLSAQEKNINFIFDQNANSRSAIELMENDTIDIGDVIYNYQSQIEYALTWRSIAIETYEKFNKKEVLTAADLNYLNYAIEQYRKMREPLFQIISRYAPYTNKNVSIKINDKKPTQYSTKKSLWNKSIKEVISLNPNDQQGQAVIKQIKLALVFALLLYDNYLVAMAPFEENQKLRFVINELGVEPENRGYLADISESYTDSKKLRRLVSAINFNYQVSKWEDKNSDSPLLIDDADYFYLNQLISGSFSYREMLQMKEYDIKPSFKINRFNVISNKLYDRIKIINNNGTELVSKMFGNTAGMIVVRRGTMELLSDEEKSEIIHKMEPMDILLEKAPFRLTDYFIPGYWCHVGVWAGNENQLKALGVWDSLPKLYDIAVEKYGYTGPNFHNSIRSGRNIIESLRPGVQINTLQNFLNIDDLGVIRFTAQSDEDKKTYLINAFSQIGKNYDFSFNVESTDEIVCSELVYASFEDLVWDTKKQMGRYTISPDQVARKLITDTRFAPVLLYLNGKSIDGELKPVFNALLD
ncbi:MAG: hypothetical protein HN653_05120 [Candidatus Marinimicrobia bacterium]|nr:hypothetical protein [Candidatus Neomarinimicrobiota bacterium]MDG2366544.1 YiiX/YebB-like N1pC/P60 family cysteine hydrolase [Candidatus Neomarinimicrobiota bacterium]